MSEEDESQSNSATEINLDALEEALGDDTVLLEEDDDIMVKMSVYDSEDDELDIAFTDGDDNW